MADTCVDLVRASMYEENTALFISRSVLSEYSRHEFNRNCVMRTPAFSMAKVGLKRFLWQAYAGNQRLFLQRRKLIHWPFRYPQRTSVLCLARPSIFAGPRSGPQFDRCAAPYRCLGRHGAWDLTGDSRRVAPARKVAKFGHDSPKRLSTAKAIPPLTRAKRRCELYSPPTKVRLENGLKELMCECTYRAAHRCDLEHCHCSRVGVK